MAIQQWEYCTKVVFADIRDEEFMEKVIRGHKPSITDAELKLFLDRQRESQVAQPPVAPHNFTFVAPYLNYYGKQGWEVISIQPVFYQVADGRVGPFPSYTMEDWSKDWHADLTSSYLVVMKRLIDS